MSTTLQMRIDKKIKIQAQQVFKEAGLDLSTGIRILLARVAKSGNFLPEDELTQYLHSSSIDITSALSPLSKKESVYYENL